LAGIEAVVLWAAPLALISGAWRGRISAKMLSVDLPIEEDTDSAKP